MAKHMVTCVECGRRFDFQRGGYYDRSSRRYTCMSCSRRAGVRYTTYTSDKSKSVALILCIFFGYFGAHYFYVGRVGRGLLYLLTLGLFSLGWFADIFAIASGRFKDSLGYPLRQ